MTKKHNILRRKEDCPSPEDIVALALDDVLDADRESLQKHLNHCPECQKFFADTGASVGMLQNAADEPIGINLLPGVLARLPQNAWRGRSNGSGGRLPAYVFAAWLPLRIAAIALMLAGVGALALHLMYHTAEEPTAPSPKIGAVDKGTKWLLAKQTLSGDWDATALGGKPEYDTALNGLAILALSRANGETGILRASLGRAAACLIKQQAENGRLGKDVDGTMYNHGVATLALLEVYRITQDEQWRTPITKALTFILNRQSPAGGWGYVESRNSPPNTSVTAWQVQSLLQADKLGWQENRKAVRKALAWMAGPVNKNGYFGYEGPRPLSEASNSLTMMGAYCVLSAQHIDVPGGPAFMARVMQGMGSLVVEKPDDYYGAFFFSSALAEATPGIFEDSIVAAQDALLACQQTAGSNAGAWLANDRWGSSGGMLYSTSMAMLALTSPHTLSRCPAMF